MKIIKPLDLTSILNGSSIAEPDPSVGEIEWTPGTYNFGNRRIKSATHRVYEVVADPSTTDDPEVGVNAVPATWVDVGPTNKYAMFSDLEPQSSVAGTNITITLQPGIIARGIAGFGVLADTINITATSALDGVVYNENLNMIDDSHVVSWSSYYFNEPRYIDRFWKIDLPFYSDLTIVITFTAPTVTVKNLVLGNVLDNIGQTQLNGTSASFKDYSELSYDQFGNFIGKTDGQVRDTTNYQVAVDRYGFNNVSSEFKKLTGTPSVYIGSSLKSDQPLVVFGIHSSFGIDVNSPSKSFYSFKVEAIA